LESQQPETDQQEGKSLTWGDQTMSVVFTSNHAGTPGKNTFEQTSEKKNEAQFKGKKLKVRVCGQLLQYPVKNFPGGGEEEIRRPKKSGKKTTTFFRESYKTTKMETFKQGGKRKGTPRKEEPVFWGSKKEDGGTETNTRQGKRLGPQHRPRAGKHNL